MKLTKPKKVVRSGGGFRVAAYKGIPIVVEGDAVKPSEVFWYKLVGH